MEEEITCHKAMKPSVPQTLYVDCGCCSGCLKADVATRGTEFVSNISVAAVWWSTFTMKLDAMHLMLRIGREMKAKHPRRKNSSLT